MAKSEQLTMDDFLDEEKTEERNPILIHTEKVAGMMAEGYRLGLERSEPKIQFKRLSPSAILPTKAHSNDSGFDLYASEDVIIEPGGTKVIPTGIAVGLPQGTEAQVRPRSGITSKTKIRVQLGTIDKGFTGGIGVIADNIHSGRYPNGAVKRYGFSIDGSHTTETSIYGAYVIRKGDKIAQLVVQYIPQLEAVEVPELDDSQRGSNGFGSTGVGGVSE